MTEAAADARSVVDAAEPTTDEAGAGKEPAAQSHFSEIKWSNIPIATRTVDLDLKPERCDFIEGPKGKGAQHAPELGRDTGQRIGLH